MVRTVARGLALLGLALVEVPLVAVAAVAVVQLSGLGLVPLVPPAVGLVRRMADLTRTLCGRWCGVHIERPYPPEPPAPVRQPDGWYRYHRTLYRSPRLPAWRARFGWLLRDPATWRDLAWLALDPLVKAALAAGFVLVPGPTLKLYGRWAALLLAPTPARRLAGEVERLAAVRNRATDQQAAEMLRIERDLHDGAQARLVALGMAVAAAEALVDSRPEAAKAMLGKAREGSLEALAELRRVVRGINPPVLAERGLADALRALALDSPLRATVQVTLPAALPAPLAAAVYFAVSELLSNAVRHGGAGSARVVVGHADRRLCVRVDDDGTGGADPARGTGLRGIERRLAAFDGTVTVVSPAGGPTSVTLVIPDALPEVAAGPVSRAPVWENAIVVAAWSLAWLPLFPQGLVAAAFKLADAEPRGWFLPLYLRPQWQWPMIAAMVALGTGMYFLAIWLPVSRRRRSLWPAR